ncbi:MAG: hypothetical protein WD232_01800 [Acidimicrobiales bacterium]
MRRQAEGPHVRLGLVWFAVVLGAALAASIALGVVLALAAALAAAQVVRLRTPARARGGSREATGAPSGLGGRLAASATSLVALLSDLHRLTAALAAGSIALAAVAGPRTVTAAAAAALAVALVVALFTPPPPGSVRGARVARASVTVASAVAFGGAAAAVVLVRGEGVAAVVTLILLVSLYDAGDFLVGTGSSTVWEGPVAGIAAVVVVALGASLVALVPLGRGGPLVLAAVVALGAPAGPPLVSVLIGDGDTPARFARRLDAWLVVGPVGAWAVAAMAG